MRRNTGPKIVVCVSTFYTAFSLSWIPSTSAQTFWEPLELTSPEKLRWKRLAQQEDGPGVTWKRIQSDPENERLFSAEQHGVAWSSYKDPEPGAVLKKRPADISEAEILLDSFDPTENDYLPLMRLGPAVPTANQLDELSEAQLSFYQLAPTAGGGSAGGTGNQNYVGRLDLAVNNRLQVSGFYSEADDPLFSPVKINGQFVSPSNFWQSYGGGAQFQLALTREFKIALSGSLEGWNVGSGGALGAGQISQTGSPNIFNSTNQRVYTRNVVGSLALPVTWQANKAVELTFSPGISFLPATQGAGQGGAGQFYGTNITVSGGAAWKPSKRITLFGSSLLPLGPGTNNFNSNLEFSNVPIITGGLNYSLNPRVGLEASLTNGFGGTPATALLALPSSNQLMYMARMVWSPQAVDTPILNFTSRTRSLTLGGVTVNTALIPPASVFNIWANADDKGNLFGQVSWSASNDFQFIFFDAGAFQQVSPVTTLVNTYANNGGFNQRFGGKAVFMQQLRGAPLTAAGTITLGRNYDASSFQGYLFAEANGTWEANRHVAFNINPKLAWSGLDTPFGLGVSFNIQMGQNFQIIPEVNVVSTGISSSNATISLRWLPQTTMALDIYVSNAAGLYDIGQLMKNDSARIGGKFTIQL